MGTGNAQAMIEEEKNMPHTILDIHPGPDSPGHLINNDIAHAILAPLAEDASDFLASADLRDLKTHQVDGRLDAQQTSEPILRLRYNDSRGLGRQRLHHSIVIRATLFAERVIMLEGAVVAGVLQRTAHVCVLRMVVEGGVFGDQAVCVAEVVFTACRFLKNPRVASTGEDLEETSLS